jgi:hypothetical protein
MVKVKTNLSNFQVFIKNYPISISLTDSLFEAMVIEQGRYTGKLIYNISASFRWNSLQGSLDPTKFDVQPVGLSQKLDINKQRVEIIVKFRTTNYIPSTGTIEVNFPASISKVYPHCRSSIETGSVLSSAAGFSGEIGCAVQKNRWIVTSFSELNPLSTVILRGFIDLPNNSGPIGAG